jgi:hypothetical protein
MANELSIDLSQNEENNMTKIAERERAKLFPKNDFAPGVDEYSVTNPDALADGDSMGRGTGIFLDIFNENAGTREDINERRDNIRVNPYNQNRPYPQF